MSALFEKDRLQRERDDIRLALESAYRIDAPTWRAEKHANLWDFARVGESWRNGRSRRVYKDIRRSLSLGALLAEIKQAEEERG